MDCDLQHPPETLVEMYRLWEQGYQVIEGVKSSRGKEGFLHKKCAGFFYGIMSKATGVDMQNASDFKLMDRRVAESILSMPERNMFFRATSSWVGFKTISVSFEVREREAGVSKWSAWSLVKYAFTNIVAFTTAVSYTHLVNKYNMVQELVDGGTFLLNCPWDMEGLEKHLPGQVKAFIANHDIKFYTIDGVKIGIETGMGPTRINTILQSAFFKLADIIPADKANELMKAAAKATYGRKGERCV